MRRAIPEPLDSPVSCDVVDVTSCQADVDQLSLAQVVQVDPQPLALASFLKRTPISPEQTRDAPRRCGWRSGRLLFRKSVSRRCDGDLGAARRQSVARGVFHQGNGEAGAEPCGIAPSRGCEVRFLWWHRMLLLLCRQVAWPNKRPRPMPAGPGEKIASSNS
jgi:hypothetical protein